MSRALGLALLPSRAGAILLGTMGVLGLLLAANGLYDLIMYSFNRRIREIGIRVALGAKPGTVGYLVCRSSLLLWASGSLWEERLAILPTARSRCSWFPN